MPKDEEPKEPSSTPTAPPPPRTAHILLVADNSVRRTLVQTLLERAGYTVTRAETGLAALDLLEEEQFDLALLDVQTPEMDGFEVAAAIRSDPRRADLPIIAVTGHTMAGGRERCLEAGMDDCISTPVRSSELQKTIAKQLEKSRIQKATMVEQKSDKALPPVLDRAAAISGMGGDEALFEKFLNLFQEDIVTRLQQIENAAEDGDLTSLERLAHNLRGAAATLGAYRMRDAATRLEEIGQRKALGEVPQALEQLKAELNVLREAIKRSTVP